MRSRNSARAHNQLWIATFGDAGLNCRVDSGNLASEVNVALAAQPLSNADAHELNTTSLNKKVSSKNRRKGGTSLNATKGLNFNVARSLLKRLGNGVIQMIDGTTDNGFL